MTRYHMYDEESNLLLWYGCNTAEGYFYEILEVTDLEKGEGNLLEKKSSLSNSLTPDEFYQILDDWEVPREHLLAISLSLNF